MKMSGVGVYSGTLGKGKKDTIPSMNEPQGKEKNSNANKAKRHGMKMTVPSVK